MTILIFILSEDGEFGEEEITKLKNWNDWSQNLDYSKMAKYKITITPIKLVIPTVKQIF